MADRDFDEAAHRRDLPAVVDAVGERLAMPPGLLAACARALVERTPVAPDVAPAVVRVVLEVVVKAARTCTVCAEVHAPREETPRGGGTPLLTWGHPDGHRYQEACNRGAYWLDTILQEGA